jgi:hypothetical protein
MDELSGRRAGGGRRQGMILIFSVVAVLLIAALSMAFLTLSLHSSRSVAAQVANERAFYVAEAGLDEAVLRITHLFEMGLLDPNDPGARFAGLDSVDIPGDGKETIFRDPPTGAVFKDFPFGSGTATVWVKSDGAVLKDRSGAAVGLARDFQVVSSGTAGGVTCSLQRNMRYQVGPTHKFDFGLLSERLPACMFCHLEVHGDAGQVSENPFRLWSPYDKTGYLRSSIEGNLYLKGPFTAAAREPDGESGGVNQERLVTDQGGRILQSQSGEKLADWGTLAGHFKKGAWYDSLALSGKGSVRLAQPPAPILEKALDGKSSFLAVVPRGQSLAATTPSQSAVGPVVDGHLVLLGTAENPLLIDRAITVHGDVVIRGEVSGTGNLNASGNIYVVDSVKSSRPPADPKNALAGSAGGGPADKLGLVSAANVLIGSVTTVPTARFLWAQFVDVQGSGYEWAPAEALNNHYALDGNRDLATRQVGAHTVSTPGLLPEGAVGGVYTRLTGISYLGGWVSASLLSKLSNQDLDRIDATLFADHAIAGGQPSSAPSRITILGGVVGREVGILSARERAPGGLALFQDNRNLSGNPLGFPPEPAAFSIGWFRIPPRS